MKKSTLTMPSIDHRCMPVVPTARIQGLIEKKNLVLSRAQQQADELQTEISRLVEIEQRKVFSEYTRFVIQHADNTDKTDNLPGETDMQYMAEEIRTGGGYGK